MQANHFELKNFTIQITYSSSSFDGRPQFSYKKGANTQTFRGDEIQHQESAVGTLVSVTLRAIPDLKTILFTLLVPQVNIPDNENVTIRTKAIETTIKTTIGGPDLVSGSVQTYKTYSFKGVASLLLF